MHKLSIKLIASIRGSIDRKSSKLKTILLSSLTIISANLTCVPNVCLGAQSFQIDADHGLQPLHLSLADAQSMLLTNNVSLQVSYEKLYQARKNIIASRSMFFPDATWFAFAAAAGPAGAAFVGGVLLGTHLLSIPSKWFDYKAIKEMAKAEEQTLAAVKRNLWLELTQIYYHVYKDQLVLSAIRKQCRLHDDIVGYLAKSVQIGASTDAMLIEEQRSLSECRGQEKAFEGILAAENAELRMLLTLDPRQRLILDDADIAPKQKYFLPESNVEGLARAAIYNSPEVKQLGFIEEAAINLKKSANLSILTFSGLGFGYTGRVKIAKSEVRAIKLSQRQLLNEIRNQVYATYEQLGAQIEFSDIVAEDYKLSKRQLAESRLRYDDHLDNFKTYAQMHKRCLQAQMAADVSRVLVQANYATLAAQVGYEANGGYSVTAIENPVMLGHSFSLRSEVVQDAKPDKVRVTVYLDAPYNDLMQIESVNYTVQTRLGGFGDKISRALETRFAYEFKSHRKNRVISFSVRLRNGKVFHQTTRLDLRAAAKNS